MSTEDKDGHASSLEYHRMLLEDPRRMDAYERAIRVLVKKGDVVLDLGAGTGILAMLAAKRGAARVHAVESTAVAELARIFVADNGLEDVIEIHRADMRRLPVVEPVDLVISDFMGHFVVDDGMFEAVQAAQAWMKPAALFCPHQVELNVAPVGDIHFRAVDMWHEPVYGLDLSAGARVGEHFFYLAQLRSSAPMATAQQFAAFAPPAVLESSAASMTFSITRPGRFRGFAGWFVAQLAPGISLSTGPGNATHWGQMVFPAPAMELTLGDRISLHLEHIGGRRGWRWRGTVEANGETVAFERHADQWRLLEEETP